MAIKSVNGTGLLRSSGGFLNPAANFSFCYWIQLSNQDGVTYYRPFSVLGDDTYAAAYIFVGNDPAAVTAFELAAQNAALASGITTAIGYNNLTIWYHIGITYDSATHTFSLYVNGSLFDSFVLNVNAAGPFTVERLGYDSAPPHGDISFAYYRSFAAKLSATEMKAEMASSVAVHATPFCDTPLSSPSDLADVSGNSRNWTAVGALDIAIGPVLDVAITNTDATTAIDLGNLPTTIVQNARDTATHDLWFKYTAIAGDNVIGLFAFGDLSVYKPTLKVYSPDISTWYLTISAQNRAIQIPVTPGNTYWFKVETNSSSANPSKLIFSGLSAPNNTASAGMIGILDDNIGFPLALLDSITGLPVQFIKDFGSGDFGIVLPNGKIITATISSNTAPGTDIGIRIYDPNLLHLFSPTLNFTVLAQLRLTSDNNITFYIIYNNAGIIKVTTISSVTGLQGATTWILTGGAAIAGAPSLDNTIFYYSIAGGSVKRWDLINNVALSDFLGAGSSTHKDILVLQDGTILLGTATTVKRYDSTGTLLNTYTLGDNLNRMCQAINDPTSFWVWLFESAASNDYSKFVNINISSGAVITETPWVPQYESGVYGGTNPRVDPEARFGHSNSCPIFIIRASPVTGPFSGIYFVSTDKTNDTLYASITPGNPPVAVTEVVAIPNPFLVQ